MLEDHKEEIKKLAEERDRELERLNRKREFGDIGARGCFDESIKVRQKFNKAVSDLINKK